MRKTMSRFGGALMATLLALGFVSLSACEEGPMEEAGEEIDEAIDEIDDEL